MYSGMVINVRSRRAMLAGGLAAFLLASIGFWAVLGASIDVVILKGSACAGLVAAVFGAIIGFGGSTARSLTRAGLIGAGTIVLAAALPLVSGTCYSISIGEGMWLLAAACSFGSICAQVGAIASGRLSLNQNLSHNEPSKLARRFLPQVLAFFIPLAIFAASIGCVSYIRITQ